MAKVRRGKQIKITAASNFTTDGIKNNFCKNPKING
jgi:hypothetical protein